MSIKVEKITQIGIVTADLSKMVKCYEETYGLGPWKIFIGDAVDLMVNGAKQHFDVKIGLCMVGDFQVELIQPLDEYSDYARHLKEHGEGVIHHISVVTDNEAFRETMKERGNASVMRGDVIGIERFEYFDTRKDVGTMIEIHDWVNKN